MKQILPILFILLGCSVNAQLKKNKTTYNTKIDSAKKVEIIGGKTTILKADTVFIGQLFISPTLKTKIYFLGSEMTKDSLGFYTTRYKFAPDDNPGSFSINLTIKFNKPFVPFTGDKVILADIPGGGSKQTSEGYNQNLTLLNFKGQITGNGLNIVVKSKEPLSATIYVR